MMSSRRLLLLLVSAVLVLGSAYWLTREQQDARTVESGGKVLPGVGEHVNDVSEVRIVAAGDVPAVSIRKIDGKRWGVMERNGYPADQQKLARLLIGLGDLETVEQKTSNAANYARLGVEDVSNEKAGGLRVDVLGLEKPVSLIVGNSAGGHGSYVRPADSAQSLLARPQLSVERNPANWLDRRVLNIPADAVQQVQVSAGKNRSYLVTRERRDQADFSVPNSPKGRKLSSPSAANPIASALADLTLDDVRAASAGDLPEGETSQAEYQLFDGSIVTLAGTKAGNEHWLTIKVAFDGDQYARFAATASAESPDEAAADDSTAQGGEPSGAAQKATAADSSSEANGKQANGEQASKDARPSQKPAPTADQVQQDVDKLAQRVNGWHFKVPAYKYETIFQPIDDLLAAP